MRYLNSLFIAGGICLLALNQQVAAQDTLSEFLVAPIRVNTSQEPLVPGIYKPTWPSLKQYDAPEWFCNAKFGIWAHWGPQCQPEDGDWYARMMYLQGEGQYKYHVEHFGHPSEVGFKDVIHAWKAEKWNPEQLVALYKRAGAKYFFAMGNHHDNLDMWDSKYQQWNSVAVGPHKDIIAGWADAAQKNGLPFGISIHAAHAWTWYEPSRGADKDGAYAGKPYDGNLTKADGKGKWWEGLDPQELYAQNHPHSEGLDAPWSVCGQWNWNHGANTPDQAYCDKFYNRTMDVIKRYHPDLLYFDDTGLPLWPVCDAGLDIVSNFYNLNPTWHQGEQHAVVFGKILTDGERDAIVWDIERGVPSTILPYHWQTCSCIGGWHYDRGLYERNGYKSSTTVIQMLADIVSKNGNLLLNIPVRGDGTIDEKEIAVVEEIAAWMAINQEAIFDTHPWKIFGEGPASEGAVLTAQGFNEGKGKPFTAEDIRFTVKEKNLYALILNGEGDMNVTIKSLASTLVPKIKSVEQLGNSGLVKWEQTDKGLMVQLSGKGVVVLKVAGAI